MQPDNKAQRLAASPQQSKRHSTAHTHDTHTRTQTHTHDTHDTHDTHKRTHKHNDGGRRDFHNGAVEKMEASLPNWKEKNKNSRLHGKMAGRGREREEIQTGRDWRWEIREGKGKGR